MSIREALFSKKIRLEVADCAGAVAAETVFVCPPAIPLAVPGEVISRDIITAMKKHGITHCFVVQ